MVTEHTGSLLDSPCTVICHSCNCHNTMGSGIAKSIREKYPEAYEADCKTKAGDLTKLGTYSVAKAKDGKYIINMYNQSTYGRAKARYTSYDAVIENLERLLGKLLQKGPDKSTIIGFPCRMCSVLGGADWDLIKMMIYKTFDNTEFDVRIYDYEG